MSEINPFYKFDDILNLFDKVEINTEEDLDILKQFCEKIPEERVIKYLKGELFFPLDNAHFKILGYDKVMFNYFNNEFLVTVKFQECLIGVGLYLKNNRVVGGVSRVVFEDGIIQTELEILQEFYESIENKTVKIAIQNYPIWIITMLIFIAEYKDTEFVKDTKENKKHTNKHTNNNKRKTTRQISNMKRKTTYKITKNKRVRDNIITEVDKKPMVRHTESWTVRGHWRTIKTGKEVWIKPHVKGIGEITTKIYKV